MTSPTFRLATPEDVAILLAVEKEIGETKTYGQPLTIGAAREETSLLMS